MSLVAKSLSAGVGPMLGLAATGVGHVFWYTLERPTPQFGSSFELVAHREERHRAPRAMSSSSSTAFDSPRSRRVAAVSERDSRDTLVVSRLEGCNARSGFLRPRPYRSDRRSSRAASSSAQLSTTTTFFPTSAESSSLTIRKRWPSAVTS